MAYRNSNIWAVILSASNYGGHFCFCCPETNILFDFRSHSTTNNSWGASDGECPRRGNERNSPTPTN
ncbi:SH2 domain-containing protein 1A [Anopheles sinensis]|uniref:SH2 domain-containing protein 1A n=1 Tax=Anopheles sinensis TaxID=74873 RepID=A0A084WBZ4_ANOSI|nr:SH2 domain-containing protein 1A [Anopheles sinensis]